MAKSPDTSFNFGANKSSKTGKGVAFKVGTHTGKKAGFSLRKRSGKGFGKSGS